MQTRSIFSNVSKGVFAKKKDLIKAFDTDDEDEILRLILLKGDVQVSEKERKADTERKFKDIASVIHQICINTETQRPFPVVVIEDAMRDLHYSVHPTRTAKQQALVVISLLKERIPISRSQIRLKISVPANLGKSIRAALESHLKSIEGEDWSDEYEFIALIDPGSFREVDETIRRETKGKGSMEILDLRVVEEGEGKDSIQDA